MSDYGGPSYMNISLNLAVPGLDESDLQSLTIDLVHSVQNEGIGTATRIEGAGKTGQKGDPITIGTIALTVLGSHGIASKLVDVLKANLARQPKLKVEMTHPDGTKLVLDAESLSRPQLDQTIQQITTLLRR